MEVYDQSKLFVGGISWETTAEVLKEHFAKYGTVIDCSIAKDRNTGTPRGFAFVSFLEPSAVDESLLHSHSILGRTVDVKKARPRAEANQNEQQQQQQQQQQNSRGWSNNGNNSSSGNDSFRTKKIFVGGLPSDLTDQEFRTYFAKFGRITDVVVMHDNITRRPRGFGFITFENEDSVETVMLTSFHELSGKLVEVKKAVPKDGNTPNSNSYNSGTPNFGETLSYYDPTRYTVAYPGYAYGGLPRYPYGPGVFGGYPNGVYGRYGYGPTMVGFRGGNPVPYGNLYSPYWNPVPYGYNGFVRVGTDGKSSQFGSDDVQMEDATSAGGM